VVRYQEGRGAEEKPPINDLLKGWRIRQLNGQSPFALVPPPNAVVTALTRRYEISTGLLYAWRKQALAGLLPLRPRRVPDVGLLGAA
jgi:hypothetical protein